MTELSTSGPPSTAPGVRRAYSKRPGRQPNTLESIWDAIDIRGPHECWNWTKAKSRYGYGRFSLAGEMLPAHRVVCTIAHGPSNLFALHSCDNRSCCNPAHLRWGTASENSRDMVNRKRLGIRRRLTNEDIELAQLLIRRGCRALVIAEAVGCSVKHVKTIKSKTPPAPPLAEA